jgi:hypothetical protein
LLIAAFVALPVGFAGGMLGARIQGGSRLTQGGTGGPPQPALTALPTVGQRASNPTPESRPAGPDRLAELTAYVAALDDRLARLDARKPESPAGLDELRAQFERLISTAGELAPLPGAVRQIDDRVKGFSSSLQSMGDELSALRTKTEKLEKQASTPPPVVTTVSASATAPAATSAPAPHEVDHAVTVAAAESAAPPSDSVWAQLQPGIKLFKQSRFKDALGVFNRLELSYPDDARVWYYAALCLGFCTDQWNGGTQRLVEKGIERERAGTPVSSTIDAAFSDLPANLGRDWIVEYRRRAAAAAARSEPKPPVAPTATERGGDR